MPTPPVPFNQFVVKVHSRCDLACDHCYIYESADQGWLARPKGMSDAVMSRIADRIAEHAASHDLSAVQVVLHGGEPLLAGVDGLRRIIARLHAALRDVCQLDLRIHTNGVQLSEEFCQLFAEYGVRVGISLDGDRVANDRHRRYRNGRSSYDQVLRAIDLLQTDRFRPLFAGVLCTVDTANDPVAVYQALVALKPPRVDFLLPHATWDEPPPRTAGEVEQYADWLIAIYDRWLTDGRPFGVRTFESILSTLAGGDSSTEALGLTPSSLAVIETDGSYEQADSLKVAYDGAAGTELSVLSDRLDVLARHPGIVARQQGRGGLSRECQECPVVTSCGGGLYAHRYRSGSGFGNRSVYCADLLKLITHVDQRRPQMPASHVLSGQDFQDLATGRGSAGAVYQLAQGQRTLRRALLKAVYQTATSHIAVDVVTRARLTKAWAVLNAVDTARPDALSRVLDQPFVRSWAAECLSQLRAAESRPAGPRAAAIGTDLDHLGVLAASAAIRAGLPAELDVPVRAGVLPLPTLGQLVLGPEPEQAELTTVRLIADGDVVQFQVGPDRWKLAVSDITGTAADPILVGNEHRAGEWQPTRVLRGPGLSVVLEDGDPYRDCYGLSVAPRLSRAQFQEWQRAFVDVWAEITSQYSGYVSAITDWLTTLVPLASGSEPDGTGAAERHAFGAVAVSSLTHPAVTGRLILAAFQRAKLDAICDLFDLYDRHDPDAPAIAALLAEAYVGLTVGEKNATAEAIEALSGRAALTQVGRRFVAEMRQSATVPEYV